MAELTDYKGAAGLNFYEEDPLLKRVIETRAPDGTADRLSKLGAACGGRLLELVEASHRDGSWPVLEQYDRWGARVDRVVYSAEQLEARQLAFAHDCLPPAPLLERMAKAYLLNQNGEGGFTCPLAMTDGLIELLENDGTPAQKERWLPLLRSAATYPAFTAGQFVTERQGGSNVSENETTAEPLPDGTWSLTGLKWFCSNPGELWVTTAKPKGSEHVGLFLMSKHLPDGSLNACRILRLKDLSATRGKATAEVEYAGARAELIGRPSHGLALLLRTVIKTSRVHVAAGSLGMMRRALVEAKLYAGSRKAFGRPIAELAHVRQALDRVEALWTAASLAYWEEIALLEKGDPAADVLVPLLKVQVTRLATDAVRQARLIFAGNAVLRDFSILPRLAEDTMAQEIWEGTHGVLASHVLRALKRPSSRVAFFELVAGQKAAGKLEGLMERVGTAAPEERAAEGLQACALAWRALSQALLQREAGGKLDHSAAFRRQAHLLEREPDLL